VNVNRLPVPPRFDLALSALLIVAGQSEVWLNEQISPKGPVAVCEFVIAAAVAWRRAAPLSAIAVAGVGSVAEAATGVDMSLPAIPLLSAVILVYTLVSYVPLRRAMFGTALMFVWITAQVIAAHQDFGHFVFGAGFIIGAWLLGRTVRVRTDQAIAAQAREDSLRRAQEERSRRVVAEERGRIARELHDVIAHAVSVMLVQAGGAQQVLRQDPDRAEAAMDAVLTTGRQAITELARLLGVMREDGDEIGLAPQPSLAELPRLIADARAAGLPVQLEVSGVAQSLPVGVELAIYRIVQESLTNVRKHAGSRATARVALAYGPGDVVAEVTNTAGDTQRETFIRGTGNGLVGMRERVAACGGTLAVEHEPGGEFTVRARLPVETTS